MKISKKDAEYFMLLYGLLDNHLRRLEEIRPGGGFKNLIDCKCGQELPEKQIFPEIEEAYNIVHDALYCLNRVHVKFIEERRLKKY